MHQNHREGSIDVNTLAVIKKNIDGTVMKERMDDGFPAWTLATSVAFGFIQRRQTRSGTS